MIESMWSLFPKSSLKSVLNCFFLVELSVTAQKPSNCMSCPAERNIDTRNFEKTDKYSHFTTDITYLNCKVNCLTIQSFILMSYFVYVKAPLLATSRFAMQNMQPLLIITSVWTLSTFYITLFSGQLCLVAFLTK